MKIVKNTFYMFFNHDTLLPQIYADTYIIKKVEIMQNISIIKPDSKLLVACPIDDANSSNLKRW